jgi:prophage antirepressor-like protein
MAAKKKKQIEYYIWGEEIKPEPKESRAIVPLEYEGYRLRVVRKNGEPWWVLADLAKLLGYSRARDAARMLRAKEKGAHNVRGVESQEEIIVSEAGLYRLIMNSRAQEAEAFQDWVCDEVLPSIRKHGCYPPPLTRVTRWTKRIGCDERTAAAREKNCEANIGMNGRLAEQGATPHEFRIMHNAVYIAQFGKECKEIKKDLGTNRSPLDKMSAEVLAANYFAKILADKKIKEENIPLDKQAEVYEEITRAVSIGGLAHLGPEFRYGVDQENPRGPILDVVRLSLPSPN